LLVACLLSLLSVGPAPTQILPRIRSATTPKLEPIAETLLLMDGLAQPNFRSLERQLRQKPADAQTWAFARGQALLIAETGNLLMLRPPHNSGQSIWQERAMELREMASALARACSRRDYGESRSALKLVAQSCNRCHEAFRVTTRITPFAEPRADEP
jgi:hypothetical protein